MRRVRHAAAFEMDLRAQLGYLAEQDHGISIDRLEADLRWLEGLLAEYPSVGLELRRRGTDVLRRATLRSTPFFAWYQLDEADRAGPVTLYRLFHVRQRRRRLAR